MVDTMTLPSLLAGALDTTTLVAGLILSCAVLITVMMILAMLEVDLMPMTIVVLGFAGLLTAVGWLSSWFIIMAVLVVCALAGARFMGGSPSDG